MVQKALLALPLFVIILLSSGCVGTDLIVPVPTTGHRSGPSTGAIDKGKTTRTEIIDAFGQPTAQTPDERFALYRYGGETGGLRVVGVHLHGVSEYGKMSGTGYAGWLLLEFDNNDRVKREKDHRCGEADPHCGVDLSANLLALLETYYDASLAHKYQPSVALCDAASRGTRDRVAALLAEGVDVNSRCSIVQPRFVGYMREFGTPLHVAVINKKPGIAEVLLVQGANVNAKDTSGYTPLHRAFNGGNADLVRLVLARRPELNVKDQHGYTPLHLAVIGSDPDLVKLVLAGGADANVKDQHNRTPLHDAAYKGNIAIVKQLLAAGAAVNVVDGFGKTPLDVTTDQKVIDLLKQYGAKD